MSTRLRLLVGLFVLAGCSETDVVEGVQSDNTEDMQKIAAVIQRQLAKSDEYGQTMQRQCLSMPGMGWDAGAEIKCKCVKDRVRPNMELVFEEAKSESNGSNAVFESLDWGALFDEKVTKQSFKDCGFKY